MFSKETYTERRRELIRRMPHGGLIVLPGNAESPANYRANTYRFRQDSTFLYYFGLAQPGLAAVIDINTGATTLLGDDPTIGDIIWTGPQPGIRKLADRVGVVNTAPYGDLASVMGVAGARGRKVHVLPPYRDDTLMHLDACLMAGGMGLPVSGDLIRAVVSMRDKKSPEEIAEIEKACVIGYEMHTLAMRMCRPGVSEREIAGAIEGLAIQRGWGTSFPPIVTHHGETLHNINYDGVLEEGRLLLVDAGAEAVSNYCSDNTRTMPVSGKFTTKQKEIYDIVLAANNRAFELSKPGVKYVDVHLAAARIIVDGLHSLGLVRGDVDEAVAAGVHSLFMPHGLGHNMGLDVHDMENLGEKYVGYDAETPRSTHPSCSACRMGRRLEAGMVVTVEPGIYFIPGLIDKWEAEGTCAGFIDFGKVEEYLDFGGIRLEDDMLITPDGNRLLGSRRLPVTTDEVEEAMRA